MRSIGNVFMALRLAAVLLLLAPPGLRGSQRLRILPSRIEAAPGLAPPGEFQKLPRLLEQGVEAWGLGSREGAEPLELRTIIQQSGAEEIRLDARLALAGEERAVFAKRYVGSPEVLSLMATRLLDDLSLHLKGHPTPSSQELLLVKAMRPGASEIVLRDVAGRRERQLTHHGSLTHSPTAVRRGRFAYITYISGPPQIWGMDLGRDEGPRRLYPSPGGRGVVSHPALSPDGEYLAFVEADATGRRAIHVLPWAGGPVRRLTPFALGNDAPAWSPDGRRIAFVHEDGAGTVLRCLDLEGGTQDLLRLPGQCIEHPSWSPEGGQIVFTARDASGRFDLQILDLASRQARVIHSGPVKASSPKWNPDGRWIAFAQEKGGIHMLNVADLSSRRMAGAADAFGTPRWVWPGRWLSRLH